LIVNDSLPRVENGIKSIYSNKLIGNTVRTRGFIYLNLEKGCGDNAGIDKKLMGYVELDGTGITCKWGKMRCEINQELVK
jgi:hypothetical protein